MLCNVIPTKYDRITGIIIAIAAANWLVFALNKGNDAVSVLAYALEMPKLAHYMYIAIGILGVVIASCKLSQPVSKAVLVEIVPPTPAPAVRA